MWPSFYVLVGILAVLVSVVLVVLKYLIRCAILNDLSGVVDLGFLGSVIEYCNLLVKSNWI